MPSAEVAPVEVIIVNFNAGAALVRCVRSVLAQNVPTQVTVIDNASSDGSMTALTESLGATEGLQLISNQHNQGFARAVNQAVSRLTGRGLYLLILNPDCEMLDGSLATLCDALNPDGSAALAGPMVVDRNGKPMRGTLRRIPDPKKSFLTFSGLWRLSRWYPAFEGVDLGAGLPEDTGPAEAVSGACMLIRKEVFLDLDGMDEAYGLHCEDLDLMYRLGLRGFHCLLVPAARVFHEQGISSSSRPFWVHWQKHLGMQRFFRKFQACEYPLAVRWLVIAGIWLRFLVTAPVVLFRS